MRKATIVLAVIVCSTVVTTVITSSSSAQTIEEAAKMSGQFFGRYYTGRMLCTWEGIPMPELSEMSQKSIELMKGLQKDYPEPFGLGFSAGKAEAISQLSNRSYYPIVCDTYRKMLDKFR
jgi:hypothetical protein